MGAFQLFTVCFLGSFAIIDAQSTATTPAAVVATPGTTPAAAAASVPSDSFNSRHAQAVGYEAEDVADDTAKYCRKIKDQANETYIEADDARAEFGLSDDVSEAEASDYYYYVMREAMTMMELADTCMMTMDESLDMDENIVDMAESLAVVVDNPDANLTEVQMAMDDIRDVIGMYQKNVTTWSFAFVEHSENVIAALRDAMQEIMEEPGASAEALDDSKDSKNEIKEFANKIIELADDMRDDADESYEDMMEDLDDLSDSLGMGME